MSNFIINNKDILKNKIEMIDSLINMKVVTKIIDDENKNQNDENDLISIYYNKLHCEIKHISPNEKIYSILSEYLKNTSKYYSNIKILELYSVNREGEDKKYLNLKNKYLLWHGTRISNFVGILSQGLRIAPPEAPSSGYLYGKGLYFADMFAKSYNYCSPQNGIALILLVEVCLGNIEKRYNTDWKLPNTMKKIVIVLMEWELFNLLMEFILIKIYLFLKIKLLKIIQIILELLMNLLYIIQIKSN
jgi:poly [ADP-ribose] polymerase